MATKTDGVTMYEEIEVSQDAVCSAADCGQPLGDIENCVGTSERMKCGLEILHVYHKPCAPRWVAWDRIQDNWRWN